MMKHKGWRNMREQGSQERNKSRLLMSRDRLVSEGILRDEEAADDAAAQHSTHTSLTRRGDRVEVDHV